MDTDALVPISALQHLLYCPRQCALIHIEGTFDENLYTLRGQRTHERVDTPGHDMLVGVRVERALPLFSRTLGLSGRADAVEFLADGTPHPVEYKTGPRKLREADDVQLCAQGLCLEEMLGVTVPGGSLYYERTRRRRSVTFDEPLRDLVRETTRAVRDLFSQPVLPAPVADSRCPNCSLLDACLPYAIADYRGDPALFEVSE